MYAFIECIFYFCVFYGCTVQTDVHTYVHHVHMMHRVVRDRIAIEHPKFVVPQWITYIGMLVFVMYCD